MKESCGIGQNRMPYRPGMWTAFRGITLLGMLVLIPNAAFSQPVRTAWPTSRISGSPEPAPPLQTVQKFSALKFDRPLLIRTDSAEQRRERKSPADMAGWKLAPGWPSRCSSGS